MKFVELEQHPDFCDACHLIGGYCGNCHGGYWSLKVDHYTVEKDGVTTIVPEHDARLRLAHLRGELVFTPMYKV